MNREINEIDIADSIKVHNKYKFKGNGVYIRRPSCLGNPFSHLENTKADFKVKDREEAVDSYEVWLRKQLRENLEVRKEMLNLYNNWQESGELNLICWCSPKRCHGDVIKDFLIRRFKKLSQIDKNEY